MPSNSVTLVAVCLHRGFGQTERAEKLAILFRSLSTVCSALVSLPLLVLCSVHAVIYVFEPHNRVFWPVKEFTGEKTHEAVQT